jgi:hypothetical protein
MAACGTALGQVHTRRGAAETRAAKRHIASVVKSVGLGVDEITRHYEIISVESLNDLAPYNVIIPPGRQQRPAWIDVSLQAESVIAQYDVARFLSWTQLLLVQRPDKRAIADISLALHHAFREGYSVTGPCSLKEGRNDYLFKVLQAHFSAKRLNRLTRARRWRLLPTSIRDYAMAAARVRVSSPRVRPSEPS